MPITTQTGGLSSQTLEGADGANNTDIIYGDANKLKGTTGGGADTIIGGDDGAINYLYGDAYSMEGKSKGGADVIKGGSNGSTNYIYGDAYSMQGKVQGGNDILVGGIDSKNIIYGDAYSMRDGVKGGGDVINIDNNIIVNAGGIVIQNFGGPAIDRSLENSYTTSDNFLIGDAYIISGGLGGNDFINQDNGINIYSRQTFLSALFSKINFKVTLNFNISNNELIGDAVLLNNGVGGDDVINVSNDLIYSSEVFGVSSRGIFSDLSAGSSVYLESLMNLINNNNKFIGDSKMMFCSIGGNDAISIFNNLNIDMEAAFSRTIGSSHGDTRVSNTFLIFDNEMVGDAITMLNSRSGDDVISLGNNITIFSGEIISDARDNSSSNSQTKIDISLVNNSLFGDAQIIEKSKGGNDIISVGNNFIASSGNVGVGFGEDSTATISSSTIFTLKNTMLYGDAETMNHSKGGDDTLSIGVGIVDDPNVTLDIKDNSLFGDAKTMTHSQGGNDKLTGADGKGSVTYLYGDAQFTDGHSKAGNDVLTSGRGNDQMWGDFASVVNPATSSNDHDHEDDDDGGYGWDEHESDHDDDHHAPNPYKYAGKDTFVFKENNGNDTIFDFQHGLDKIDLSAANIFSVDGLHIEQSAANPSDIVIDLGGGNSITLVGVSNVVETDFVFAGISI